MTIDGRWYTETELMALVEKLKNRITELENEIKGGTDDKS